MSGLRVAVAAGTEVAARAGAAVARQRGNAVDAAVAATLATWVAEPGLTSPGSGGFGLAWPAGADPMVYDGFAERPGRDRDGEGIPPTDVEFSFGGGSVTGIGPGSLATPGALPALEALWLAHGTRPWPDLVRPAIDLARAGCPLSEVSWRYFQEIGHVVYRGCTGALEVFLRSDGEPREIGELVRQPALADSLAAIADYGGAALAEGPLGERVGRWLSGAGGPLGPRDLAEYQVEVRPALRRSVAGWDVATNPRPALGGERVLDVASSGLTGDVPMASIVLRLRDALAVDPPWAGTSHVSTVDDRGLACAITTSTGYGSGVVVPGTGILFNNMLGEAELFDEHAAVGDRLRSNMAPTVLRHPGGRVIALGAAGADRIISALVQVILRIVGEQRPLARAVADPRCHPDQRGGAPRLAMEPGLVIDNSPFPPDVFDGLHMFFGGVQAAELTGDVLRAVGDPRRGGAGMVG